MADEVEPQGEAQPQAEAEPQGSVQEAAPSAPPGGPQKAGPAQVVGCWIILLVIAALVIAGAYMIGRLIRSAGGRLDTTMEQVEQSGIGDGSLEAGETYKGSIHLEFVSMAPTAPASQPEEEEEEESAADKPTPEDKTPPAAPGEAAEEEDVEEAPIEVLRKGETAWIVRATATNTGKKTVTYLKVQVTLTDDSGKHLGGSWVDAATAIETSTYVRYFGEMLPGKVREFEARVWVGEDSEPDKVSLEVAACAVK